MQISSHNAPSDDDVIAIYRETVQELYAFVSRRCGGSRELAEDVTQETYLCAVSAFSGGKRPDEPLAWLQTVARNLLLNYFRKKRPAHVDPDALACYLERESSNGLDASAVVYWGLGRVKATEAALLESFYIEGQSCRALSTKLGLSERAVEGRLRRARKALKNQLKPYLAKNGALL